VSVTPDALRIRCFAATGCLPQEIEPPLEDEIVLDLPDAPRPDPDTPAPVRFLPAFDNALLGYHDRSRIIDNAHRGLSVAGARVVLVDGRVAATWSVTVGTVIVTPLRRFSRADRTTVAEQGRALASFLSDNDSRRVQIAASPR
ncbi:DNA glycosylase AlkZ-like family protein, partial [Streptosporangium sp. NPDC001682]